LIVLDIILENDTYGEMMAVKRKLNLYKRCIDIFYCIFYNLYYY